MGNRKEKSTASLVRKKLLSSSRPRLSPRRRVEATRRRATRSPRFAPGFTRVTVAALGLGVLGLAEGVFAEAKLHLRAGEVLDGGDLVQEFAKALPDKPFVGVQLDLDQVRHLHDLRDLGVPLLYGRQVVAVPHNVSGKRHR